MKIKSNMKKSELQHLIKEEFQSILEAKSVQDHYNTIIDKLKSITRSLNDDDAFELHEKLKKFFNKSI